MSEGSTLLTPPPNRPPRYNPTHVRPFRTRPRFGFVKHYALSIKQPWAALLVHGRKTIEVRRWPTARRGTILIHAGLIADDRPEAWKHVPDELIALANLKGGFIGSANLDGCIDY